MLSNEPIRSYSKAQQLFSKRIKPTAKQRGEVTTKVRQQLYERSKGNCERCGRLAVHAAHVRRRWKLDRTTVEDLLHLCLSCHYWADNTAEGRAWLRSKEQKSLP